ncbi:MAG TPA: DUF4388 domain-containing protein [Planktothrix sp.]|jgi:hypothetical protein
MYRPKPIPPIRLNKLENVPEYDDLASLFEQLRHAPGRRFELPIVLDEGKRCYMLAATVGPDGADPEFAFYSGLGNKAPLLWTHTTKDFPFLLNLLLGELTGVSLEETIAKAASEDLQGMRLGINPAFMGSGDGHGWGGSQAEVEEKWLASLEGDLQNMPAPSVLQSIMISKLSGMLTVTDGSEEVKIYFMDGMPTHGMSIETTGDGAVTELLTWEKGRFKFFPNEHTTEKTVRKRLEVLLMEGVTMLDQRTYLNKNGLTMDTYLIRKDPNMSEPEFVKRVSAAAPIPFEWQKNFYLLIDGETNLFDLLRACPVPKAEWVPVMFNLISCEIVVLSDRPAQSARKNLFYAAPIDRASIDGAIKVASREETGIFTYPMMAYFLDMEFMRFEAGGPPFALVLFEMMYKSMYGLEPPSNSQICEVVRRVKMVQRNIDLFGHWETFGYSLLLPQTDAAATSLVVMRLSEVIRDGSMEGDINKDNLALAIGVGNVPEDCRHMGVLLAGVKEAKERAKRGTSPIVLMRSLENTPGT